MASTETRKAADRLDNAYRVFADENGDGFGNLDWRGAYDYREDGYELGNRAYRLPVNERSDFIENAVEAFDDNARYLVSCAAAFRLAELEDMASQRRAAA